MLGNRRRVWGAVASLGLALGCGSVSHHEQPAGGGSGGSSVGDGTSSCDSPSCACTSGKLTLLYEEASTLNEFLPFEDGWLVVHELDAQRSAIERRSHTGEVLATIVTGRTYLGHLAVVGDRLFYFRKTATAADYQTISDVVSVKLDGSDEKVHVLADEQQPASFRADGDTLFYTHVTESISTAGAVLRLGPDDAKPVILNQGLPQLVDLVVQPDRLVFASYGDPRFTKVGGIGVIPKQGGEPTWWLQGENTRARYVMVDGESYWFVGDIDPQGGSLFGKPTSASAPRLFASNAYLALMHGGCLLYAFNDGLGVIDREGSSRYVLAPNAPSFPVSSILEQRGVVYVAYQQKVPGSELFRFYRFDED